METEEISQKEVQSLAALVSYKTVLLIRLCENTLSEEEGRNNVHRRFVEREKSRKKMKILNLTNKIFKIFGKKFMFHN